jgi:hypothetical protein
MKINVRTKSLGTKKKITPGIAARPDEIRLLITRKT